VCKKIELTKTLIKLLFLGLLLSHGSILLRTAIGWHCWRIQFLSFELLGCRFTKRLFFEFVNTVFMGFYSDDEREKAHNDVSLLKNSTDEFTCKEMSLH